MINPQSLDARRAAAREFQESLTLLQDALAAEAKETLAAEARAAAKAPVMPSPPKPTPAAARPTPPPITLADLEEAAADIEQYIQSLQGDQ